MPTYSADGLKNGIEGCKKNIAVLKQAIQKERATITEYTTMIRDLEALKEKVDARDKFVENANKELGSEPINDYPN